MISVSYLKVQLLFNYGSQACTSSLKRCTDTFMVSRCGVEASSTFHQEAYVFLNCLWWCHVLQRGCTISAGALEAVLVATWACRGGCLRAWR